MKLEVKIAQVLKRSMRYLDAMKILERLESELTEVIENESDYSDFYLLAHKVAREKARLHFWQKDFKKDEAAEDEAREIYSEYLNSVVEEPLTSKWGFPVVNIKVIKIMIFRAYRLAFRDKSYEASKLYEDVLQTLESIVPKKGYHHAKVNLELAKCYAALK